MLRVSVVVASLKARTLAAVAASAAPKPMAPSVVAAAPAPLSFRKLRRDRSTFIVTPRAPVGGWVRVADSRPPRQASQGRERSPLHCNTSTAAGTPATVAASPLSGGPMGTAPTEPRLTSLAHGGGCGCKIAPGVLERILREAKTSMPVPAELLVGIETSDDAAVYRINDRQAVVATTDFFMPIVDDPHDFGRI